MTFGVATIVFGLSTSFALSLTALFILGAADNISVVIRQTVLQLLTPDSMRGRVTAVSVIFIGSSNELGEFESGVAASWLGLVPSVVFGGVMTLVTVRRGGCHLAGAVAAGFAGALGAGGSGGGGGVVLRLRGSGCISRSEMATLAILSHGRRMAL